MDNRDDEPAAGMLEVVVVPFYASQRPSKLLRQIHQFPAGIPFGHRLATSHFATERASAIERGANLPSIESFLAISKAFDKKPSEILASIDF
jgi:hypothetical protein